MRGNVQQYQMILQRPASLKSVYKVGIVGCKLCAGRLIELRIVPPYITQFFEQKHRALIHITYLKIVATQIDKNVISARSLCASFDHVKDVFPTNSGRGDSGCWVRSVP